MLSLLVVTTQAAAGDDPYADEDDDPYAAEDAGSLFKEGVLRMTEHDWETACPRLDRSYQLDPRPGTLYTLAECETKRGRLATGAAHFKRFIAVVKVSTPLKQRQYQTRKEKAERRRAEIEPLIPMLALTLPPDAPWTTLIKLDGVVVELSTLGAPRETDPGPHVITVEIPGGKRADLRVNLENSEKKQVVLPVDLPPKPCAAPVSPAGRGTPMPGHGGCSLCPRDVGDANGAGIFAVICTLGVLARRRRGRLAWLRSACSRARLSGVRALEHHEQPPLTPPREPLSRSGANPRG